MFTVELALGGLARFFFRADDREPHADGR